MSIQAWYFKHICILLCYVLPLSVYPVTDVIPPSYEDVYPSGAPPSYNEALSHHITSAVTYNVNPPVQTEPIAAVRVVPQNSTSWRPQQRSTNRQV